ncbi:uncharacterized protein LOC127011748 [Drosophila biarmipes]|uniref:uncharacterized protein LOC127011748 n=1 Tax=Drosophila biarmipes TaxID=125945 RepID=UPI0021CCAB61|nr:uncharacterized protein LOC127011748 [Drosophila biarmipes]
MRCVKNLSCLKWKVPRTPTTIPLHKKGVKADAQNYRGEISQIETSEPPEKALEKAMRCVKNLSCLKWKVPRTPTTIPLHKKGVKADAQNYRGEISQIETSEPPEKALEKAMRCVKNLSCLKWKVPRTPTTVLNRCVCQGFRGPGLMITKSGDEH